MKNYLIYYLGMVVLNHDNVTLSKQILYLSRMVNSDILTEIINPTSSGSSRMQVIFNLTNILGRYMRFGY